MSATDVEVVRALYEAFNRGDYATATAMLHDHAELHQVEAIPDTDTYFGRDEFVRGLNRWLAGFEPGFQYVLEEMIDAPDGVFVRLRPRGRGRTSGVDLEQAGFNVWELRDGHPFRCRAYFDEGKARVAAGLGD
jgi:uncharacterized protein